MSESDFRAGHKVIYSTSTGQVDGDPFQPGFDAAAQEAIAEMDPDAGPGDIQITSVGDLAD